MDDPDVFLQEDNFISLRTAIILEDRNVVSVRLLPKWFDPVGREEVRNTPSIDSAWLYRSAKDLVDSEPLDVLGTVEKGLRPLVFDLPPEFKLVWSDSGNSLVVYLNSEPWAFIDEQTRKGYSKGILDPSIGCQWDEVLFRKVFGESGLAPI